ncbi:hypothetical protein TNIN_75421 [Trichonephila inaurata madagascariensis]|uniref:Uncharacterized protein n=1 Tax=Trichonephila inaurata madagascariensis TaxID=2747483 RepID=A0A8X7BS90_9ARAC|nr:hypothetical protein TNIN_75421 [Trichonephila inaurata madagascariensis]
MAPIAIISSVGLVEYETRRQQKHPLQSATSFPKQSQRRKIDYQKTEKDNTLIYKRIRNQSAEEEGRMRRKKKSN